MATTNKPQIIIGSTHYITWVHSRRQTRRLVAALNTMAGRRIFRSYACFQHVKAPA